jgi:hypothetical protein
MVLVAALGLVFLGILWYLTFTGLETRGPDLVVLSQEKWDAGEITVLVQDVRPGGEVLITGVNVTVRTASNVDLYDGPAGETSVLQGFNLTVTYQDTDNSLTLTRGDKVHLRAEPAAGIDNLILSTFYLSSDGREWARLSLPP